MPGLVVRQKTSKQALCATWAACWFNAYLLLIL
jgi:hypothetical protein